MEYINDLSSFLKAMDEATVILTPNRRLAAYLHQFYQQQQLASGKLSWPTPDILPIQSWLMRTWQTYTLQNLRQHPLLLTSQQELTVWEKIITDSTENMLLQVSATAEQVQAAWALIQAWHIQLTHPAFNSTEDYQACLMWMQTFITTCRQQDWVTQAELPTLLLTEIEQDRIKHHTPLCLYGFTELSPQLQALLEVYSSCKQFQETDDTNATTFRVTFADPEQEIWAMAAWAKQLQQQATDERICCIFPALDMMRDRVLQIFSEVFANPDQLQCQTLPFNLSAGKPLLSYPLIYAALQLLNLYKRELTQEKCMYLLTTPFIGDAENEYLARVKYDRLLKESNVTLYNVPTYLKVTEKKELALSHYCPKLAKRLQAYFDLLPDKQINQPFTAWIDVFVDLLSALGWPGERSLNSEEYQVLENWQKLLTEYKLFALTPDNAPISFAAALQLLNKSLSSVTFQPQSPDANIQILGVLEAAGMPFTHIWLACFDELNWPPQPKPNPFIPKALQRELQMPHATAERELYFCQRLLAQFKQSTQSLIFSHAEKQGDVIVGCSPLIANVTEIKITSLLTKSYQNLSTRIYATKQLELLHDDNGPSIQPQEKIYGGMSVIKQQALCPFKAFAEWRLHAHPIEPAVPGLRSKDRGIITHKILEIIWQHLQDQANLLTQNTQALDALIHQAIDQALTPPPAYLQQRTHFLSLEKARLFQLIKAWLEIEKQRAPFKVIAYEKQVEVSYHDLKLKLRIDRIDQLADGQQIIIDYKTNKTSSIHHWFSERPDEPQLPLYLLENQTDTSAISFAQLYTGDVGFIGLSQYDVHIKGVKQITDIQKYKTDWHTQLNNWQTILAKLSQDFCNGVATVDPKEGNTTCTWCSLSSLCRVYEKQDENTCKT